MLGILVEAEFGRQGCCLGWYLVAGGILAALGRIAGREQGYGVGGAAGRRAASRFRLGLVPGDMRSRADGACPRLG